jgi:hypothetical protein
MFPVMSIPPPTNPVGHLIRVYNAQERAAIDPFKTEYMAATTPARTSRKKDHCSSSYSASLVQLLDKHRPDYR